MVTGILVAFVCPVTLPFWTILIGDFFAIVVVKQLFGGIGANIVNPALAARAFLFSWPLFMNTWVRSGVHVPAFSNPTTASLDGLTAATPMASLHVGAMPEASVLDLFLGRTGGSLGEVSALLLLLGGIYLLVRRVISARIPLAYLGTVAVLAFLFPRGGAGPAGLDARAGAVRRPDARRVVHGHGLHDLARSRTAASSPTASAAAC